MPSAASSVTSTSTRTQPVFNPATGEAGRNAAAVERRRNQLLRWRLRRPHRQRWGNNTPMKRARVMFKFKELLEKNADELAR